MYAGQEVASYWYSTVRRYNYFKDTNLLHTNVNAGKWLTFVTCVQLNIKLVLHTQFKDTLRKWFG